MSKKPSAIADIKAESAVKATDYALAPINAALSSTQRIELYRTMIRIRRFEERSLRAYQGKNPSGGTNIGGFLHLYIG